MNNDPASRSTNRARWLAELALALEKARRLAQAMPDAALALDLTSQIEAALAELERLRRSLPMPSSELPKPTARPRHWQQRKK